MLIIKNLCIFAVNKPQILRLISRMNYVYI
jgi:hypothetical protein